MKFYAQLIVFLTFFIQLSFSVAQEKGPEQRFMISRANDLIIGTKNEYGKVINNHFSGTLRSNSQEMEWVNNLIKTETDAVRRSALYVRRDSLLKARTGIRNDFLNDIRLNDDMVTDDNSVKTVSNLFSEDKYDEVIRFVTERLPALELRLDSFNLKKGYYLAKAATSGRFAEQLSQELLFLAGAIEYEQKTKDWSKQSYQYYCKSVKIFSTPQNIKQLTEFSIENDFAEATVSFFDDMLQQNMDPKLLPGIFGAMGDLLYDQEKYDSSENAYRSSIFTVDRVDPKLKKYGIVKADALNAQARIFHVSGKLDDALAHYRKSMVVADSTLRADSTRSWKIQLNNLENIAEILMDKHGIDSALKYRLAGIDVIYNLSSVSPAIYMPYLADVQMKVGKLFFTKKDTTNAILNFREASDTYAFGASLDNINGSRGYFMPLLGDSYSNLVMCYDNLPDSVISLSEKALASYLAADTADLSKYTLRMASLYNNVALTYAKQGNFQLAEYNIKQSLKVIDEMYKSDKSIAKYKAEIMGNHIYILKLSKQSALAVSEIEQLMEQLPELLPKEEYLIWFSRLQDNLAFEYNLLKKYDKALDLYSNLLSTYLQNPGLCSDNDCTKMIKELRENIYNAKHPRRNTTTYQYHYTTVLYLE